MSSPSIIKQGYLNKQSLVLKQFRKRWIVLKGTIIHCYSNNNKETDTIDLTKYNHIRSTSTFAQFEISSDNRKIKKRVFTAKSKKIMFSWIEVIQGIMVANQYNLLSPVTRPTTKLFERSKSTSKVISRETSDNEFQNICKTPRPLLDYSESNTDRNLLSDSLQREYSRTDDIFDANDDYIRHNDAFCKLKNIEESQLLKVLKTNEIIFDSLMSVYSSSKQTFTDVAAVLLKNYLYLISPINYEIWQEFRDKSQIDQLLANDTDKIDEQTAVTMAENLDIVDDITKITPSLKGQTKKDIKLNLLLNQKRIVSLSSFFQLDEFDEFGADIPGGYDHDNKIRFTRSNAKVVWIQKFKHIIPSKHTLIILKSKTKSETLICRLECNNKRHEWLTHLDYVRNSSNCHDEFKSEHKTKDKLIQDFTHGNTVYFSDNIMFDEQKHEEFSNNFSFGEYLDYWRYGYKNSVNPNHATLKDELLHNKIKTISEENYYWLYNSCVKLLKSYGCSIKAQNIGVNNKQFKIPVGTVITINHLMALKLYTDFSAVQKQFKKHCRKCRENETIEELVRRNSEIGHWSRYLKESVMFYGTLMRKKTILYTGLKIMLTFSSMKQHFECPLSTTTDLNTAQNFCDDNGIILKFKAANSKTRYFDVSRLSHYPHENERLIMGSSLKICDIYINSKSTKEYIFALQMLEQIIDGQFLVGNPKGSEETLFNIISFLLKMNRHTPPSYIVLLFNSMIKRMRKQNNFGSLWINKYSLQEIKHKQLRCLLNGCGEFFNFYKINFSKINWVQQCEWVISGDEYKEFINTDRERLYIKSSRYEYSIDNLKKIGFHVECCSKYSNESKKITLFFYLDTLPINIEAVRIQYSVLCQYGEKIKYHEIVPPQWLSKEKIYCGGQTFLSKSLHNNSLITSISWLIGIKLIDIRYVRHIQNINENILSDPLNVDDEQSIVEKLKILQEQNARLQLENARLRCANKQLRSVQIKQNNQSDSSAPVTPTVVSNSTSNIHIQI